MRTPVPPGRVIDKLKRLDWIGTAIIVVGTCLLCIALAWAGVEHSWSSAAVLVPFLFGIAGLIGFGFYEAKWAANPLIPFHLLGNRTTIIGYFSTFINSLLAISATFFLPVYLQGSLGDSPIRAGGLHSLGITSIIGPTGIIAGVSVKLTKRYLPQILSSWIFMFIGFGLVSRLGPDSTTAEVVMFSFVGSIGVGALFTTTYFPVLAPLPVTANARALSFFNFCRSLGQVWAIAIGSTILQNELKKRLPTAFTDELPEGTNVAYAVIPQINHLPEPLRSEVQKAFADSVSRIWYAMLAFVGAGFISNLWMEEIPMPTVIDAKWAMQTADQDPNRTLTQSADEVAAAPQDVEKGRIPRTWTASTVDFGEAIHLRRSLRRARRRHAGPTG